MLQLVIRQISHQNVRAIISTLLHVYHIEKQVKVTHFCVSVYHAVVLYQDSLNCGSQPWPGSEENGLYLPLTYPHMERERNRRCFSLGRKLSFLHPTLICFSYRRLSWSITALSPLFHQHLSGTSTHTVDLRTRFPLLHLPIVLLLNNEICLSDCFRRRNKRRFNLQCVSWSVQFELGMRHKRGEAVLQSRKINQALQPVFRARWDHGKCKQEDQS